MKTRFLVCSILALTTSAYARVKLVACQRARVVVSLTHPTRRWSRRSAS
jgi:hypothetical protein